MNGISPAIERPDESEEGTPTRGALGAAASSFCVPAIFHPDDVGCC